MVNFLAFWRKGQTPTSEVTLADVLSASERLRPHLSATPLTYSPALSEIAGRDVYLKWDNKLRTGSFKEHGAVNFIEALGAEERARGLCAASAGNHALALSYHASRFKIPCTIVMPKSAPLVKVQATRATGSTVVLHGAKFDESYSYAQQLAKTRGQVFVPAYDHPLIVAGQGTLALELLEQIPDFDSVLVPVGGGGLVAGVATVLAERAPQCAVIGVQSQWATAHEEEESLDVDPALRPYTIADGIAVKSPSALTAAVIQRKVQKLVSVHENDIARAVIHYLELEHTVVEGAGAAALAALLAGSLPEDRKKVVVLVTGSNIDTNVLSRLIERSSAEAGRLLKVSISLPDRPGALHTISGIIASHGANVLEVIHDRSFSTLPGNVDVLLLLEVRDNAHRIEVLEHLRKLRLAVSVMN